MRVQVSFIKVKSLEFKSRFLKSTKNFQVERFLISKRYFTAGHLTKSSNHLYAVWPHVLFPYIPRVDFLKTGSSPGRWPDGYRNDFFVYKLFYLSKIYAFKMGYPCFISTHETTLIFNNSEMYYLTASGNSLSSIENNFALPVEILCKHTSFIDINTCTSFNILQSTYNNIQ